VPGDSDQIAKRCEAPYGCATMNGGSAFLELRELDGWPFDSPSPMGVEEDELLSQTDSIHACIFLSHEGSWLPREHICQPFDVRFHDIHAFDLIPREIAVVCGFVADR
jgi:hypothetical protein